jgi:hypothetical protein
VREDETFLLNRHHVIRYIGGILINLSVLLTLALYEGECELYPLATLIPRKYPAVHVGKEAGWTSE